MLTKSPWIKLYPDQFLKELTGLKAIEKAVYTTLVLLMSDKRTPLLNNASYLSGWCGCSVRTFQKTLEALINTGHITRLEDGSLWHRSFAFDHDAINKFSERASKAAIVRWRKRKEEARHVN